MDQLLVLPRQDIHHVIDLLVNRKAFIIKPADGYLAGSLFVFHVIEGICRVHALDDGLELGGEGAQLLTALVNIHLHFFLGQIAVFIRFGFGHGNKGQ